MKKWIRRLFYVPKYEKVEETTITARAILMLCTIVVGLAAMGISAYAYFSYTVSSESVSIKSASFETVLTVRLNDENGETVIVYSGSEQARWVELRKEHTYYVMLQRTQESTAKTGYVSIKADGSETTYHTQQLGKDGASYTEAIAFRIQPAADVKLLFRDNWGTSSYYGDYREHGDTMERYITNGEEVAAFGGVTQTPPANQIIGSTEPAQTDPAPTEATTPPTETTEPPEETAPPTEGTQPPEETLPQPEATQPTENISK